MEETVSTLTAACPEVQPPSLPDKMTSSLQQTEQWIAQCQRQQEQLQLQLGTCRGQMAAIGREEELQWQLDTLNRRIDKLEDTWAALSIAQETLTEATQQLQRRFAPKITQTAQALFQQMTIGRYEWLSMDEELRLQTAARTEDTLRSSMWRSDGTVDQLYLALRLAVARELTPEAPLVLDEALARFDDERLGAALEVLRQEAKTKQVILFTCQSREEAAQEKRLPPKPAPEKPAQEKAAPEKQNLFLRFLERLQ